MYEKLTKLNIEFDETQKLLFDKYISMFLEYNKNVNLISKNDTSILFEKHIYDSLALNLFIQKYEKNEKKIKLLDIGTGGGFPSLPAAMYFKNINVFALDSVKKKLNFIDTIKQELEVQNINTINSRIEDLDGRFKNSFDIVTTRALAELRVILEYSLPFVKTGSYFIAYKSIKAQEELINAKRALQLLNTTLIDTIEYNLPIEENPKRYLLIFKKQKDIPSSYPRKNTLIKKKPL